MEIKLPKDAISIISKIKKAGFECYAVGGCVRDLLLGIPTRDFDFTTNALPNQIQKLFPDSFYDNKFGTVGIPIPKSAKSKSQQDEIYEVTTYRSEKGYSDFRHPDEITFGTSLSEDLKRRDFTMNALAYDDSKITDMFDGQSDIGKKLIRTVGNPDERFSEDALRMMRAVRFSVQLDFTIEGNTQSAIKTNSNLIKKVSGERIREEILKILSSQNPGTGIMLLRETGLLSHILPEVDRCFGVPQQSPKRHHIYDVGTHLVKAMESCPSQDPIVRFATLLHDVGKAATFKKTDEGVITFYNHELVGASEVKSIIDRLHFSKKDATRIFTLVRFHQFTVDEHQTDSAVRRFIRNVGIDNVPDMLDLRTGDRLGGGAAESSWRLDLFKKRLIEVQKQPFSVADLKANGHDVIKIYNTQPGPLIGSVLNMLFDDVVAGKIPNARKALLKRIEDLKEESGINLGNQRDSK